MLLTAPLAESSFSYQAAPRALMLLKAPLRESEFCLDHEVGHGRRRASCICRNHPPVVRGAGAAASCGDPCLTISTRPKPSTLTERNSLSRGCGGRTCSGNWSSQPVGRASASAVQDCGSCAGSVGLLDPSRYRLTAACPPSRQVLPQLQDASSSTRGARLGLLPPGGGKTEVILLM